MGSSVRGLGAGQPLQRPGDTAVVQGTEEAEGLRPATSAVAGAATALLVALTGVEVSVRRAIEARRAAVLLPGAVAVGHPAAVEGPPVAVVDHVAGGAVVEQEIEKNKG